jgi:hypothetical protein
VSDMLDLFGHDTMRRDAVFKGEDCRLLLTRAWGEGPTVCFIGCNPSRAGKKADDPTSLWWINWSQALGFGRYTAVNLYPFVSSSPAECRRRADWQNNGPDWHARDMLHHNVDVGAAAAKAADRVIAYWGAIAWDDAWIEHVLDAIQTGVEPYPDIYCFGRTASGAPMHPMARGKHRLPRDVQPTIWKAAA